ncbi:MAG: hypothetical protein K2W85_08300 [Phycisphaerales bacterium]|nr:hypothetical protein [Phycisphaerales bacterium]
MDPHNIESRFLHGPHRAVIGPRTVRSGPDAPRVQFPKGGLASSAQSKPAERDLRVLVVSSNAAWVRKVRRSLFDLGRMCESVRTLDAGMRALGLPPFESGASSGVLPYDACVVDVALPDGDGFCLAERAVDAGIGVILAGKSVDLDLAGCAMALGAMDVVERGTCTIADLGQRIVDVAERSWNQRMRRSDGPRGLCGRAEQIEPSTDLHAEHDVSLPVDLLHAYLEHAERMSNVTTATEFKGLIRGELDIEQLLRTTLEFVLARSGPTNAAVFLPTTSGDYSLGAYVNYDCPKDTCDVLLDHLANSVAPRFENVGGLVHITEQEGLDRFIGDDADWLNGSTVAAFPCVSEGECLAIVMLFRDRRSPYQMPLLDQLKTVGELFAAQLARVIHIHHRHLPKDKWGMLGDPPAETDDYGDMAA